MTAMIDSVEADKESRAAVRLWAAAIKRLAQTAEIVAEKWNNGDISASMAHKLLEEMDDPCTTLIDDIVGGAKATLSDANHGNEAAMANDANKAALASTRATGNRRDVEADCNGLARDCERIAKQAQAGGVV